MSPRTRTPLRATAIVCAVVLILALFTPLDVLAETTSEVLLSVFVLVNAALAWLKLRKVPAPEGAFTVPIAIRFVAHYPVYSFSCLFLLLAGQL